MRKSLNWVKAKKSQGKHRSDEVITNKKYCPSTGLVNRNTYARSHAIYLRPVGHHDLNRHNALLPNRIASAGKTWLKGLEHASSQPISSAGSGEDIQIGDDCSGTIRPVKEGITLKVYQ